MVVGGSKNSPVLVESEVVVAVGGEKQEKKKPKPIPLGFGSASPRGTNLWGGKENRKAKKASPRVPKTRAEARAERKRKKEEEAANKKNKEDHGGVMPSLK